MPPVAESSLAPPESFRTPRTGGDLVGVAQFTAVQVRIADQRPDWANQLDEPTDYAIYLVLLFLEIEAQLTCFFFVRRRTTLCPFPVSIETCPLSLLKSGMSTNITCLACPMAHEGWPPTFGAANLQNLLYSVRLQAVGAYALASALWAYNFVRTLPIGWQRFIAATPIIAGHLLIPFLLNPRDDVLTLFAVSFCFAWLSNFKVISHA